MPNIVSILYDVGRKASKAGSIMNDVQNVANGHPERVVKKALKREAYKGLGSVLRRF